MLIKDLIQLLEVEYQRQLPDKEYYGEPSVVIDIFGVKDHLICYKGFDTNIRITWSDDGCYRVITAWEEEMAEV